MTWGYAYVRYLLVGSGTDVSFVVRSADWIACRLLCDGCGDGDWKMRVTGSVDVAEVVCRDLSVLRVKTD